MLILLHFLIFFYFDFLTDMWLTPPPQNAVGVTADFSLALQCKSQCV